MDNSDNEAHRPMHCHCKANEGAGDITNNIVIKSLSCDSTEEHVSISLQYLALFVKQWESSSELLEITNNSLAEKMHISNFQIGQLHCKIPCWDSFRTLTSRWSHTKFTKLQPHYLCSSGALL